MDLLEANEILNQMSRFSNLVRTTIGLLEIHFIIEDGEDICLEISKKENNDVAKFLFEYVTHAVLSTEFLYCTYIEDNMIQISYKVEENSNVINTLTKILYFAIDESKVEFCIDIMEEDCEEIPFEIACQIDEWNDECDAADEPENMVDYSDIMKYSINKDMLYGISLGYFDINMDIVETDLVPELIGIIFETTEKFCYVTSYEDEENIYIYTEEELDDDNKFDIIEGLISVLPVLSETDQEETFEDVWNDIVGEDYDE